MPVKKKLLGLHKKTQRQRRLIAEYSIKFAHEQIKNKKVLSQNHHGTRGLSELFANFFIFPLIYVTYLIILY
jgi:hypothetical protein